MTKTPDEYPVILRTVVGSKAHGVSRPDSDSDFREVFYAPTRELLAVPASSRPKDAWQVAPQRMVDDEGGYEVAHFLELAMKGNPNIVELLWTVVEEKTPEGESLLELAPKILAAEPIVRAFLGYADNARNKIITDHERTHKWQSIYVRVLATAVQLLKDGTVSYPISNYDWGEDVKALRDGKSTTDHAVNFGRSLEGELRALKDHAKIRMSPDTEAINEWLLNFRMEHWDS